MNVKVAREAEPKKAAMPTSAQAEGERFAPGIRRLIKSANEAPSAAPTMNMGASKPPEVPEPSDTTSARALNAISVRSSVRASRPFSMSEMVS